MLINAIVKLTKDINIDLRKSKYIIGEVVKAETISIKNFTFSRDSYKNVFYVQLNTSSIKFAIDRSPRYYQDLEANIKMGDTLKIYYRPGFSEYNQHVFQVEKNKMVLQDYRQYKNETSIITALSFLLGPILLIASVLYYKRINIFKLMNSLVR